MGADAIPWIAVGMLLLVTYLAVNATVLAQRALRSHGEVEFELKAPSLSARLHVTGASPGKTDGEGSNTAQDPMPIEKPRRLQRRT